MRVLAAVCLALLLAAPLAAQTPIRRGIATAPGGVSLRILNLEGSVRVVGWDRDSIAVTGTMEGGTARSFYLAGSPGGRGFKLGVEVGADGRPEGAARIEVRVPFRSSVWVKSNGAVIEADDVRGGLDLYSVSGPVRVTGRIAQLSVESMDGPVEIGGASTWLRVKTADGRILLRGTADDAAVSSVSGSIVVDDARYSRARIESVTGGVEFRGSVPRGVDYSFETHSGSVTLRLAPDPDATVTVTTFGGDVRSEFGPVPSSGGSVRLGDGDATVTIRTFRGPVVLARR